MTDVRMTFDKYVAWYSWATTNLAGDAIACHAAAAAATDALAAGGDRDAAVMAACEAAQDEATQRQIRASYDSRHRYVEWFIWVQANLGLPYERCHEATEAALQSVTAGGTEKSASEAATRLLLPPAPEPAVTPSAAVGGPTPPSANIQPVPRHGYVPRDAHAFVARYDWGASWAYLLAVVVFLAWGVGALRRPWSTNDTSNALHLFLIVFNLAMATINAVPVVLAARRSIALVVDTPGIVLRATPFQRGRPVSRWARAQGRTDDRTIP